MTDRLAYPPAWLLSFLVSCLLDVVSVAERKDSEGCMTLAILHGIWTTTRECGATETKTEGIVFANSLGLGDGDVGLRIMPRWCRIN